MSNSYADWLHSLAHEGGKGVVNNIDARALGRCADLIDTLEENTKRTIEGDYTAADVLRFEQEIDTLERVIVSLIEIDCGKALACKKKRRWGDWFIVAFAVVWVGAHLLFPEFFGEMYR